MPKIKLKQIHRSIGGSREELCVCPGAPCNCSVAIELEQKYNKLHSEVDGMEKKFAIKAAAIKEFRKTVAEFQRRCLNIEKNLGGADSYLTKELQFLKHALKRVDSSLSILHGDSKKT